MIINDFYTSEATQGNYQLYHLGDLHLKNHQILRACKLAYRTFGTLNRAKDNAILVTTWFGGTGKVFEDVYVGENHALNPQNYFIIIIDQIGSGTSSSPHNTPPPQAMSNFPKLHISDDVRAQHQFLTEKYGITQLALVVGGSMGGMQAYEWAVTYSHMVKRAAPIACTAKLSFHQQILTDAFEDALTSDPAWNGGWYSTGDMSDGIKRIARISALVGWSAEFYQQELWKSVLHVSSKTEFIDLLTASFEPLDPNSLLTQIRKWRAADISHHTNGDLPAALGKIKAKMCIMPISHDSFFPPNEAEADHKLIPGSTFRVIVSRHGHSAMDGSDPTYMGQVDTFLKELLSS